MKRKLLRLLLVCSLYGLSLFQLKAQYVTIPDTTFVNWLQTNIPSCMNGNQMDTTCPGVINRITVDCRVLYINDLSGIQYFDNLDTLNCPGNLLTSLPTLPQGLVHLNCIDNRLTSLPTLPLGLSKLKCQLNRLTSLPTLPQGLTEVSCNKNQLTGLPTLPQSLEVLRCDYNLLTSLPTLPQSLTSLKVDFNRLTGLPVLPQGLSRLICDHNPLGSLPVLPQSLKVLSCADNELTSLPVLPQSLENLNCSANQLSTLPTLPQGLSILGCANNVLTVLPTLPQGLTQLGCGVNQLPALPSLPQSLTRLDCNGNQLTYLPTLPQGLTLVYCYSNLLTALPELPDSLSEFYCTNNPNLTCLPQLKRIVTLNFANTGITCLPNYGNVSNSTPPLTSMPLCDVFNTNGCDVFWNISGKVYFDENRNCVFDSTDKVEENIKVQLWSGGTLLQQTFTVTGGNYSFDISSFGTYEITVDTSNIPFDVLCPVNNALSLTLSSADSMKYGNDFAMVCKPGVDLAAWNIFARGFSPARISYLEINAGDFSNLNGLHCAAATGVSGIVQLVMSGPMSYVGANGMAPTTISGDTLVWNITDFGTVNSLTDFSIRLQTDTTALLGSPVCFTVSVSPTVGDIDPTNNTLTQCFTVVGSFDPNDKQVYPSGDIPPSQEWLTYTIRFQNTGTAEAEHIYIDDTLDNNLDEASFQLLGYSHYPFVQLKENIVRFNLPNINLPDSNTNEPASHGYIQYKIKLKQNLINGTIIKNTAYIYFDFNAAVVTNTVMNTISASSSIEESFAETIHISPNPADNSIIISINENMLNGIFTLTDFTGRKVLQRILTTTHSQFDISGLTRGIYFTSVRTDQQMVTRKLIINN